MLEDSLDSYSDGDLDGQGDWSGYTTWDIQGVVTKTGSGKAAENLDTGGDSIAKDGISCEDGSQRIWVRLGDIEKSGIIIDIRNELDIDIAEVVMYYFYQPRAKWTGTDGSTRTNFPGDPTYAADTWYSIDFQWRIIDYKVRYRFNDGIWTDWSPASGANHWEKVEEVKVYLSQIAGGEAYFDVLEAVPSEPYHSVSSSISPSISSSISPSVSPS